MNPWTSIILNADETRMNPPDPDSTPVPIAIPVPGDPFIRLARLRPEYADRYPGLDAGAWYPAASLAAYYQSWLVRHPAPRIGAPLRGLDTAHFDFRGGIPRDEPWIPGRSADDRRAPA
jgi:hypothetical protein